MIALVFFAVFLALTLAAYNFKAVKKLDPGTDLMKEIAAAIQEGADAFIRHEYSIIAKIALLAAIILSVVVDWYVGQQRLDRLDGSIAIHQTEKERLQNVVQFEADAKQIKASVEFSEAILKLKTDRTLGFDIQPIAKVIAQQGEHIQVMKLDWKKLGKFDSEVYEVVFEGWVYPFIDYYHDPVMWVDNFRASLSRLPTVNNAHIVKEPLNRDLKQALTIVVGKTNQMVDALPFQIKIEVRHGSAN